MSVSWVNSGRVGGVIFAEGVECAQAEEGGNLERPGGLPYRKSGSGFETGGQVGSE